MDLIHIEIMVKLKGLTLISARIIGMYEFHSQFLSILKQTMNDTRTLLSELVLMKLNCVRESHYVRIRMTLSGVKMYGNCLLSTSQTSWKWGAIILTPSATSHLNLKILSLMARIYMQKTLEMVFFTIALIEQMRIHSRKLVTINLMMKVKNLGQIG